MKQVCCRRQFVSRGFGSLIELLIVVLILGAGVGLYVGFANKGGNPQNPQEPQTIPGRAVQKAESVECQNNLRQIRMAVDMEKNSGDDGAYPKSLNDISGIEQIIACPIGHEPYEYDPQTGRVHCVHPGHESY